MFFFQHIFPIRTYPCCGLHRHVQFHRLMIHVLLVAKKSKMLHPEEKHVVAKKKNCITDIPDPQFFHLRLCPLLNQRSTIEHSPISSLIYHINLLNMVMFKCLVNHSRVASYHIYIYIYIYISVSSYIFLEKNGVFSHPIFNTTDFPTRCSRRDDDAWNGR